MKVNRREFLKFLVLISGVFFGRLRFGIKERRGFIRPPGSLVEEEFVYKCIRCGECIRVCPSSSLHPVSLSEGIFEWGTPHIIPRKAGCRGCLLCGKVCPTGAIRKIKKEEMKIGTARINKEKCLVWSGRGNCLVCMKNCPAGAISTDSRGRPVVNPEICRGCGLCEENCPVPGEAAIRVSNEGERRYYLGRE
ncbi:MAG: 4Fe-4S dicluster domain-containing protein [Candidatus Omnitrophota bacterium]|nr:MAG: 4Fe-4S dicluster domain-containing protein [Candidatus Omnitrophota bacterium]